MTVVTYREETILHGEDKFLYPMIKFNQPQSKKDAND
jgi:hypothetical protein